MRIAALFDCGGKIQPHLEIGLNRVVNPAADHARGKRRAYNPHSVAAVKVMLCQPSDDCAVPLVTEPLALRLPEYV